MIDDGLLRITGLVDPEYLPGLQVIIMGVKLKTLDLQRKAREFTMLRGVMSAAVVTGRYDLIVQIEICEDANLSLLDFFKYELVKIEGIQEVETFVVYSSQKLLIPYLL